MKSRIIREGFFKNESLAECSAHARLLFVGLWMLADREGLFEWRPKRIKAEVFPYETVKIESLLKELETIGLVISYQVSGETYGCIANFLKHQSINKHEKQSTYPKPNLTEMHMHPDASTLAAMQVVPRDILKVKVKSKVEVESKLKVGSHFQATKAQIDELKSEDGYQAFAELVQTINDYCSAHGKTYKDYPAAYRNFRKREKSKPTTIRFQTKQDRDKEDYNNLLIKYRNEENNEQGTYSEIIEADTIAIPYFGDKGK